MVYLGDGVVDHSGGGGCSGRGGDRRVESRADRGVHLAELLVEVLQLRPDFGLELFQFLCTPALGRLGSQFGSVTTEGSWSLRTLETESSMVAGVSRWARIIASILPSLSSR